VVLEEVNHFLVDITGYDIYYYDQGIETLRRYLFIV